MIRIPSVYRSGPAPGMELPLYWADEETGELRAAVMSYIDFAAGIRLNPPTDAQLVLIWDWIRHYINAPCWRTNCQGDPEMEADLKALIAKAETSKTAADVGAFVDACMNLGLDPF